MYARWRAVLVAAAVSLCLRAEADASGASPHTPALRADDVCAEAHSLGLIQSAAGARRQGQGLALAVGGNASASPRLEGQSVALALGSNATAELLPEGLAAAGNATAPPARTAGGNATTREQSEASHVNLPLPSSARRGHASGKGPATRAIVAVLQSKVSGESALQANAASAEQDAPDRPDYGVILFGLMLMSLLYSLTYVCSHMDMPEEEAGETGAARFARAVVHKWAVPWRSFRTDQFPAMSCKMLEPILDFPLLVPVAPVEVPVHEWSTAITGQSLKTLMMASLTMSDDRSDAKPGKKGAPKLNPKPHMLRIQGRNAHGNSDHILGSIDSRLDVFNSEGHHFAKIIQGQQGGFIMEAIGGASCVIKASTGTNGDMSSLSLTFTSRLKGRLMATVVRGEGAEAKYLQVTSAHAVDMVLVLTAALGICAFALAPPPPPPAEEAEEAEPRSMAGDLLASLQG